MKCLLAIISFAFSAALLGLFAAIIASGYAQSGLSGVKLRLQEEWVPTLLGVCFVFGAAFLFMGIALIDKTGKKRG